jgi:DNA-directed RNA polymerase specialized sigma24 family protein
LEEESVEEVQLFEIETSDDRLAQLNEALDQLGPICQQMLKLFYYNELNLEEIQHQMAYESKDTVKSQKSRCLKQLKKIIQSDGNR